MIADLVFLFQRQAARPQGNWRAAEGQPDRRSGRAPCRHKLRINAQLVPIDSDVPLWSERFDRTLDDVFAIQDEISRAIVNKLRLTLGRGQRRYQTNLQAYELYCVPWR